ncbi:MAG: pyocin knob domain-containing protein [Fusobacteriaceae bacterium]
MLRETGYDKIQLANGTRSEIVNAIDKLSTFEPVVVTDEDVVVYKDVNGVLKDITNKSNIELSTKVDNALIEVDNKVDSKLDRGTYTGTADGLSKVENEWELKYKLLPANCDLNTITVSGTYRVGNTPINGVAGYIDIALLEVFEYGGWVRQTMTSYYNTNIHYVRTFNPTLNQINPWETVWNSLNNPLSKTTNGWCKLANGMIMQWGVISGGPNVKRVTLPIAFTSGEYTVTGNAILASDTNLLSGGLYILNVGARTTIGFSCYNAYRPPNATVGAVASSYGEPSVWVAIGY